MSKGSWMKSRLRHFLRASLSALLPARLLGNFLAPKPSASERSAYWARSVLAQLENMHMPALKINRIPSWAEKSPIWMGVDPGSAVGDKTQWVMRDCVTGQNYPVPDYIPHEWLDRIKVMADDKGVHWLWTGWNNGEGHGKVRVNGKAKYTHREIWERVTGTKLLRSQYVDHKCEHKPCLTFEHLEPVLPGVNTQRGPGRHTQYKPLTGPGKCCCFAGFEPLDTIGMPHRTDCPDRAQ